MLFSKFPISLFIIALLLISLLQISAKKPKMPKTLPEDDPTLKSEILAKEQMKICKEDTYCKDLHDQMAEIRSKECLGDLNLCFKYQVKFARLLNKLCYFFNKDIENVDEMCADGVKQHVMFGTAKCETCISEKLQKSEEFHNPNKDFINLVFNNKFLTPSQIAKCLINEDCDKIQQKIENLVEGLCTGTFEDCTSNYKQILFEECEISKILLGHAKECVNMNKYYDYDDDVCSVCSERRERKTNVDKNNQEEVEKIEL